MSGIPPTPPTVSDPPTPDELQQFHMFQLNTRNDLQAAATAAAAGTQSTKIEVSPKIDDDSEPELPI